MTLIENSDRGVTLNKGLAWSVLVVLATLIWYAASTVAGLTQSVGAQIDLIRDAAVSRGQLEIRVRVLENTAASTQSDLRNLSILMDELKQEQRETNTLLRQLNKPSP